MSSMLRNVRLIWKFPKTNIFECMILHFLFLKSVGLACFTLTGKIESGKTRTSLLDRLWFVYSVAQALALWFINVTIVQRPGNISPLLAIGNRLMWFACYFTVTFGIVWNFLHRGKVWSLYVDVYRIDQQLLSLGAKMYYGETYLGMIVMTTGAFVFVGILIGLQIVDNGFEVLSFLTFAYSNASLVLLITVYGIAGCLVLVRIWALNVLMERDLNDFNNSKIIQVRTNDQENIRKLRQCMQIYDQLCDLTETVNYCYSIQIMIAVAGSFVYLLFFAFSVILFIKRNDSMLDFPPSTALWTILYVVNILVVVTVGSAVSFMLSLFLMQLGHRSPTLTCGLFPFDWSLVYSILATSTTYLIILVQFENSRSG